MPQDKKKSKKAFQDRRRYRGQCRRYNNNAEGAWKKEWAAEKAAAEKAAAEKAARDVTPERTAMHDVSPSGVKAGLRHA